MAKRRRLSPADPERVGSAEGGTTETTSIFPSYPDGVAPTRSRPRPPVADMAGSASAHAALGELAETMERARAEGRMVLDLPLEAVRSDYLVRDRVVFDEEEMQALMASLRARGQQAPVEVTELGDGSYGLISGLRRCRALGRLHEETREPRFARVLALVRRPEVSAEAYIAMVEENEIRVGLSYYERARIAAKAVDRGVFGSEQEALRALFGLASRAKRSKIGSFIGIVRALDGVLRFPEALGERAGLQLAKALDADPGLASRVSAELADAKPDKPGAEQKVLQQAIAARKTSKPAKAAAAVTLNEDSDGTLRLSGPGVDGAFRKRLELWLKRGSRG